MKIGTINATAFTPLEGRRFSNGASYQKHQKYSRSCKATHGTNANILRFNQPEADKLSTSFPILLRVQGLHKKEFLRVF